MHIDAGLGTSAAKPLVLGGLFRLQSYFGEGSDLGLVARLASGGFARGDFGLGLDAGVYQRWWGDQEGPGFVGNLVLGGPWGVTMLAGAALAPDEQRCYFASLGIDLARLTVHRHSGLNWFSNPMSSPAKPAP